MSAADIARLTALLPPYARALGIAIERLDAGGAPVIAYDFSDRVLGRPGFFHGGALSGLAETAAILALRAHLGESGAAVRLKPVNISIEFLRGAREVRCRAVGRVTRAGRRIANVSAECWQDDPAKPVVSAWMNFLLAERD